MIIYAAFIEELIENIDISPKKPLKYTVPRIRMINFVIPRKNRPMLGMLINMGSIHGQV